MRTFKNVELSIGENQGSNRLDVFSKPGQFRSLHVAPVDSAV